ITERIAFHAMLNTFFRTPPAEPAPEKADLITLITEEIPEPAIEIPFFIFDHALVKIDFNEFPAPPNFVKNPITVPTQVATVVNAGTIALNPSTRNAITGVKKLTTVPIVLNVAESPINTPFSTPPINAPKTCNTGIKAVAKTDISGCAAFHMF